MEGEAAEEYLRLLHLPEVPALEALVGEEALAGNEPGICGLCLRARSQAQPPVDTGLCNSHGQLFHEGCKCKADQVGLEGGTWQCPWCQLEQDAPAEPPPPAHVLGRLVLLVMASFGTDLELQARGVQILASLAMHGQGRENRRLKVFLLKQNGVHALCRAIRHAASGGEVDGELVMSALDCVARLAYDLPPELDVLLAIKPDSAVLVEACALSASLLSGPPSSQRAADLDAETPLAVKRLAVLAVLGYNRPCRLALRECRQDVLPKACIYLETFSHKTTSTPHLERITHLAMTVLSFYSEDVAGLLRYRVCHHVLKAMVVNILDTFVQIKGVQLLARVASAGCAPRIDASNSTSVLMVCLDKHGTSCDRLTSDILTLMILLLESHASFAFAFDTEPVAKRVCHTLRHHMVLCCSTSARRHSKGSQAILRIGLRLLSAMLRDEDVGLSLGVRLGKAGACELAAWCMASHDYAFREAVPQELCLTVMEGLCASDQRRHRALLELMECGAHKELGRLRVAGSDEESVRTRAEALLDAMLDALDKPPPEEKRATGQDNGKEAGDGQETAEAPGEPSDGAPPSSSREAQHGLLNSVRTTGDVEVPLLSERASAGSSARASRLHDNPGLVRQELHAALTDDPRASPPPPTITPAVTNSGRALPPLKVPPPGRKHVPAAPTQASSSQAPASSTTASTAAHPATGAAAAAGSGAPATSSGTSGSQAAAAPPQGAPLSPLATSGYLSPQATPARQQPMHGQRDTFSGRSLLSEGLGFTHSPFHSTHHHSPGPSISTSPHKPDEASLWMSLESELQAISSNVKSSLVGYTGADGAGGHRRSVEHGSGDVGGRGAGGKAEGEATARKSLWSVMTETFGGGGANTQRRYSTARGSSFREKSQLPSTRSQVERGSIDPAAEEGGAAPQTNKSSKHNGHSLLDSFVGTVSRFLGLQDSPRSHATGRSGQQDSQAGGHRRRDSSNSSSSSSGGLSGRQSSLRAVGGSSHRLQLSKSGSSSRVHALNATGSSRNLASTSGAGGPEAPPTGLGNPTPTNNKAGARKASIGPTTVVPINTALEGSPFKQASATGGDLSPPPPLAALTAKRASNGRLSLSHPSIPEETHSRQASAAGEDDHLMVQQEARLVSGGGGGGA